MRVLHVLPTRDPEYGGPIRVAEAFRRRLIRDGHAAELFAPSVTAQSWSKRLAYWPGIAALRELRFKLAEVDLVHVHGLWTLPTSMAALFARTIDVPVVITPHGMLDRWSREHHATRKTLYALAIEKRNLDAAAAIHFFNEEERAEASEVGLRAPTFLLPNGVDVDEFDRLPDRKALEQRYPNTANRIVFLFLGRLHPKKGLPLSIEALARLVALRPDVQLIIAGPDEAGHRTELESLVALRGLGDHVVFTGPVLGEQKRLLLGGADVFILPSHQEGDSVAVKEALAAGLPVVITHPCHFRQVAEARAGIVVNPTVDELYDALERLRSDASLRHDLAHNARPLIERDYRWEVLGRELIERYEEVMLKHRAQRSIAAVGGKP